MNQPLPLFSFGTLRDPEVLAIVSQQSAGMRQCSAHVTGYALHKVSGEDFPVMMPSGKGRVDGILIYGLTAQALDRIVFFEGDEYGLEPIDVIDDTGKVVQASYFKEASVYDICPTTWKYQQWNALEKNEFLDRVARYMQWYGVVSATEADQYW